MAELLDDIRNQISTRLEELRPLVREAEILQRAVDALAATPPARRANGRRAAQSPSRSRGPRAGSRGEIRAAVIEHVRGNPGSTASDVANALDLKRTSVATRLTQLARTGDLIKAERGYNAR